MTSQSGWREKGEKNRASQERALFPLFALSEIILPPNWSFARWAFIYITHAVEMSTIERSTLRVPSRYIGRTMSPLPRICIQAYTDKQPALECINPRGAQSEGTPAPMSPDYPRICIYRCLLFVPFPPCLPRVRKAGNTRLLPLHEIKQVHSRVSRILPRPFKNFRRAYIYIYALLFVAHAFSG